jgi:hypothetical protein
MLLSKTLLSSLESDSATVYIKMTKISGGPTATSFRHDKRNSKSQMQILECVSDSETLVMWVQCGGIC